MAELRSLRTEPGLVFDAWTAGEAQSPLVLLLHGASESFHMWRVAVDALAEAGYRAVAPSQRGYSAGARPDPADTAAYEFDRLVADAMALAAAAGAAERFHLVGHDWGGSIAWGVADRHPERLASLTILSRPHPNAFNRALKMPDGEQAHRSRHHKTFLAADAGPKLLADGARALRERWTANGMPDAAQEAHLAVTGEPAAMEAALAWYRARGAVRTPLGSIRAPTLYVWGDADDTVSRAAAEGTRDFVSGAYSFVPLAGIGHFAPDQAPTQVIALLLAHLAAYPAA